MKGELVMVLDTTIHTNTLPAADVSEELNSSQGKLTNVKIETFLRVPVTVSQEDMRVPHV